MARSRRTVQLTPRGREAISRAAKRRWRAYRAAKTPAQRRALLGGERKPMAVNRKGVKYGR